MAYDIYGGRLRRGHCEVHPDVPEEYPCSECLSEDLKRVTYPEPSDADICASYNHPQYAPGETRCLCGAVKYRTDGTREPDGVDVDG